MKPILITAAITLIFMVIAFAFNGVGSNPTVELQQLDQLAKVSVQARK